MLTDTRPKRTPLHKQHLALGAKMVPFGGWEMPLQYEGILAEYRHAREDVTVFDTSHMGEFVITGDARDSGLDRAVTQDIGGLSVKSCRYGMMLNEVGGVIDDQIVFRLEPAKWLMVVNAGTTEKDADHLRSHLADQGRFENMSGATGKLDVQGPRARDLLATFIRGIKRLDYFTFDTFDVLGEDVLVSRTGYTGELGYEIFPSWDRTERLWQVLLEKGACPAGLGVRDVLRLEMGYSLYGHELTEEISPLEAGLNRFIDGNKDFVGKESLERLAKAGPARRSIGLVSRSRRSPRAGHIIYSDHDRPIGIVTSGTFSPALNAGIGLGLVDRSFPSDQTTVSFGDGKSRFPADTVRPPFYKKGSLKK